MLEIKPPQALQKVMQNKTALAMCSIDAAIRQHLNNVSCWTYNDNNVFIITGPTLATTDDVQVDNLYNAWEVIAKTHNKKQIEPAE